MPNHEYGARRCRDSRKPPLSECPRLTFYELEGQILILNTLDKEDKKETLSVLSPLEARPHTEFDEIKLSYKIVGGYNDNTVVVSWSVNDKSHMPEWIYLKTFSGGYLKYVLNIRSSQMRFALADLDAFAYCDEDPCLECTFRCKRGFEIYVYNKILGLINLPMDYFNPYWESK